MSHKLLNPSYKNSLNQRFREKRFNHFKTLFKTIHSEKAIEILDVGGTQGYWENMNFGITEEVKITLINLNLTIQNSKYSNFTSIIGNACDLSDFEDKHFDIVFSNSVIEHLFTKEAQIKMATEIRRVSKAYYIQTPNYYFPIEPHWMFPFFQFLPFSIRVFLTKNLNLGYYKKAISEDVAIQRIKEVRLLTEKEMKKLFPDGNVFRERFGGITKSITMHNFPKINLMSD